MDWREAVSPRGPQNQGAMWSVAPGAPLSCYSYVSCLFRVFCKLTFFNVISLKSFLNLFSIFCLPLFKKNVSSFIPLQSIFWSFFFKQAQI